MCQYLRTYKCTDPNYTVSCSNTDTIIQATYDKLKMKEKKENFRETIPIFRIQKNLCSVASL